MIFIMCGVFFWVPPQTNRWNCLSHAKYFSWHKWLVLNKGKEFQSRKKNPFPVLPTAVPEPCCIWLECYAEDPHKVHLTECQKLIIVLLWFLLLRIYVFHIITIMSWPNLISSLVTLTSARSGSDPHYFSYSMSQLLLLQKIFPSCLREKFSSL